MNFCIYVDISYLIDANVAFKNLSLHLRDKPITNNICVHIIFYINTSAFPKFVILDTYFLNHANSTFKICLHLHPHLI